LGSGWEFKFRLTYFYISLAPILEFKFCLTCPVASKSLGLLVSSQEKKVELQSWLLVSNPLADQLEVV
jgi:hypothetical protein